MSDESIAAAINKSADIAPDSYVKSESENKISHCANCGKAGGNDIKLKKCSGCHLVSYCSIKCQKEHRPKHKRDCKQRAAELHDEILFQQPASSHLGDCPICLYRYRLTMRQNAARCFARGAAGPIDDVEFKLTTSTVPVLSTENESS